MRRYLLGQLAAADEAQVELRLLTDAGYGEELEIMVDELLDQYVTDELPPPEREQVEQHFFKSQQRLDKLECALALKRHKSELNARKADTVETSRWRRFFSPVWPARSAPYARLAVVLLAVLVCGIGLWAAFFRQSDVNRGLLALQAAYKEQRPIKARISGFAYAPLANTRGGTPDTTDQTALNRAERILLDANDHPTPVSEHALGRLYLAERKFDQARAQFEQALGQEQNNPQLYCDMGTALMELGKSTRANDAGKAMEYFASSLQAYNRALELNDSLPEALFDRALLFQEMSLPTRAKEEWHRYIEKDANSPWADEARRNLQALEEQSKNAERKQETLYEAFRNAYQAGDSAGAWLAISQSRARAGNFVVEQLLNEHLALAAQAQPSAAGERLRMLSFAGEIEQREAGDHYTSDLAAFYARATSDQRKTVSQARVLLQLASARYNKSEFEAAITHYAEAGRLFEQAGDSCEALFAESWIGYCELRIPAVKQSTQTFERLSRIYEEKQYRSLLAQSLHALSDAQTSTNEISRALGYAARALVISEQIHDDASKLRCLQLFVSMQLTLGNYAESLKAGLSGIELAMRLAADPKLIWPFYHEAALDFYWLDLTAAAIEYEQEALRLAEAAGWPLIISRTYERLGVIREKLGDVAAAIEFGQRALAEGQKVVNELSRLNILANSALRLGHLYREAGDLPRALASYDDSLRMHQQLGLDIYLYETHKGKFLAYTGLGDVANANAELATTLGLFEQYRAKIQEERNRNSFFDAGQGIYDLATDFALTKLHDPQQAFDYAETARGRALLDLLRAAPEVIADGPTPDLRQTKVAQPLILSELQPRLPDQVQLVQYSVLDDKLIIWVVTRESFAARVAPVPAAELKRKVVAYLRLMTTAETSGDEELHLAKELYGDLVAPVESLLDAEKQICLVPDKVLVNLPYGALISPTDGKYFVEKYRSVVAPSANVFVTCTELARAKARPGPERLLSVGNPHFAHRQFPELQALPAANMEAEAVAASYGAVPLLGAQAQEREVRAAMSSAEVIHLASHYVINEQSPMLSSLLLAEEPRQAAGQHDADGQLQAFEVYGMKLPRTRLVVLSACQTGVERSYQGEGAIGFARAFISAGAPLVVASFWPVDSDATTELMIKFHQNRKLAGLSSAEALRQAQLDMLKDRDAAKRRPYAWASFVVIGGFADF